MNKILAGYRLTFNSCDIRKENPNTIIKEGLSEDEASLLVEISESIHYENYLELRSSVPEWRIKKAHEKLYNIFEKRSMLFTLEQMNAFKKDVGVIIDYINENILGYSYEEGFDMRTLKSYKVEDIPQDIIINDVTNIFKKNKV